MTLSPKKFQSFIWTAPLNVLLHMISKGGPDMPSTHYSKACVQKAKARAGSLTVRW